MTIDEHNESDYSDSGFCPACNEVSCTCSTEVRHIERTWEIARKTVRGHG